MRMNALTVALLAYAVANSAHGADTAQLRSAMNGAGAAYQRCAFKAVAEGAADLNSAEPSSAIATRALASCAAERSALDQAVRAVARAERPQTDAAAEAQLSIRSLDADITAGLAKEIDRVRDRDQAGVGPAATSAPLSDPFRVSGRMDYRTKGGLASYYRRVCLQVPPPHAATILRSIGVSAARHESTTLCMSDAQKALELLGIAGEPPHGTCGYTAEVDVDLGGMRADGYGAGAALAKVHKMGALAPIHCD